MRDDDQEWLEIHYFRPSSLEKSAPAWPIRLGSNHAKPHYRMGPRYSPFYYLILVVEGEGTFEQNGEVYPLRPHDLFCLCPLIRYEYYTNPQNPLRKVFFAFDGKHALALLERVGLQPQQPYRAGGATVQGIEAMERFFCLVESEATKPPSDLARLSAFYGVFDALTPEAPSATGPDAAEDWLLGGKTYLDLHYADGITVESAAAHIGVSRGHFTKRFTASYGLPPVQYLQQLRLVRAQHLLAHTDSKLAEIAHSVGYPDLFSFSKAFKKHHGLPPGVYRKREQAP
ncbi:helix-turn-helix transcriptional regulator [Paenibacillus daejeonensis]|uniref:helix-turn-helix transcriptional regulator n=1 Tax=Paenibacillus daejeonensis TaxID=135193 RepID=UPI00059444B0|nr:AraC family transcriptional regulator [Paenibacillus daejeonensis]